MKELPVPLLVPPSAVPGLEPAPGNAVTEPSEFTMNPFVIVPVARFVFCVATPGDTVPVELMEVVVPEGVIAGAAPGAVSAVPVPCCPKAVPGCPSAVVPCCPKAVVLCRPGATLLTSI